MSMHDQQLALIAKLKDMGADEVEFAEYYGRQGDVECFFVSKVTFGEASQLDDLVTRQVRQVSEDPRLTPEEKAKIRQSARERLIYGAPLDPEE